MAESSNSVVHRINWTETFPMLRLFRTFSYSVNYTRLLLAFLAIVLLYGVGRGLDALWVGAGGGVLNPAVQSQPGEIDLYVRSASYAGFESRLAALNEQAERIPDPMDAFEGVEGSVDTGEELAWARGAIDDALEAAIGRLDGASDDEESPAPAIDESIGADHLRVAADSLRFQLAGHDPGPLAANPRALRALQIPADDRARFERVRQFATARAAQRTFEPHGPFIDFLRFQNDCVTQAVAGVATGKILFPTGDPQTPSLLGGLGNALRGTLWMVTERPFYALLFWVTALFSFGLFGGAICRHAAVQSGRDEAIGLGALTFSREKLRDLIAAAALPVALLGVGWLALMAGGLIPGLIGQIPGIGAIGPILSGALFFLALIGGFALALIMLGFVLGGHLLWPTIAVESSDYYDAITRAFGYVGQRFWHATFYLVALLAYGAFGYLMVRAIAMLTLKLTHSFLAAGYNGFGLWSGSLTDTVGKLDTLWQMPAWSELTFLPISSVPFWGTFDTVPQAGGEWVASTLIAAWVFVVVTLVGAFMISFYYCGSTQIYLLLRRDIDHTDYDEIYYEEEGLPGGPVGGSGAGGGGLPVVELGSSASASSGSGDAGSAQGSADDAKSGDN